MNRFTLIEGFTSQGDYVYRAFALAPGTTSAGIHIYIAGLLDYGCMKIALGAPHIRYTGASENIDIWVIGSFQ